MSKRTGMPPPPICSKRACILGSSSATWGTPNSKLPWSIYTSPTKAMKMPLSASMPSGTGSCHDRPARYLHHLCGSVPGALPPSAPRPPQGQQRQPTVPQRTLRSQPLSMLQGWRAAPRQAFLWQPPLSPGSAARDHNRPRETFKGFLLPTMTPTQRGSARCEAHDTHPPWT